VSARKIWTARTGHVLNDGKPMTWQEANEAILAGRPGIETIFDGWTLSYEWGEGFVQRYTGTDPTPADPHGAINDLESALLSCHLTAEQRDRLVDALRAAVDHCDPVPALLEFLSAPISA